MTTITEIISWAKPHPVGHGKQTVIFDDNILVSIVGGSKGLYGDFENDFELAVIDQHTKDFRTKFFFPENNDDVCAYVPGEEVEKFINKIFTKGFQVK